MVVTIDREDEAMGLTTYVVLAAVPPRGRTVLLRLVAVAQDTTEAGFTHINMKGFATRSKQQLRAPFLFSGCVSFLALPGARGHRRGQRLTGH